MKISDISVDDTIKQVEAFLKEDPTLSPAIKSTLHTLLLLVKLLIDRIGLNSKNSNKPPSSDPHRAKNKKENKNGNKPGGQKGRLGKNLKQIENPDAIQTIPLDKNTLPKDDYIEAGYSVRQVIDIRISRHVTEYRAQILENSKGRQFIASFPAGVTRPVQYGLALKANAVYQSQFQLLPYNRVNDYFVNELKLPVSPGSLYNFNKEAYDLLSKFDAFVKLKLVQSSVLYVDETGINVNGKGAWIHLAANEKFTYFFPHSRRGSIAMDAIGILPCFQGTLCHDHWKPYFIYKCAHALCNAHHIRELERAYEQDKQQWALDMKNLLLEMHRITKESGNVLPEDMAYEYYVKYKNIIAAGKIECPAPEPRPSDEKKKRGRIKKSKARNLLERLSDFETETLRFIKEVDIPFTNNLAENNIRMTKVQQKISGCFRSMEGAYIFCRIRSYLSTCRKHGIAMTEALQMLFRGESPDFMLLG